MAGVETDLDRDIKFLLSRLPNATEQQQGLFCDYVADYVDNGMSDDVAREYALRDLIEVIK